MRTQDLKEQEFDQMVESGTASTVQELRADGTMRTLYIVGRPKAVKPLLLIMEGGRFVVTRQQPLN